MPQLRHAWLLAVVGIVVFWNDLIALLDVIPYEAYIALGSVFSLAWGFQSHTDKLQDRDYFAYSLVLLCPMYAIGAVNLSWWPSLAGLEYLPAAIVGVIGGFATLWVAYLLTASLSGRTLEDIRKERYERIDDEYGDKHAAKILNND